jgi:transposase
LKTKPIRILQKTSRIFRGALAEIAEQSKRLIGAEMGVGYDAGKKTFRRKTPQGFVVLPRRWVVERTFAWISFNRRLSKDYEYLPDVSETFI